MKPQEKISEFSHKKELQKQISSLKVRITFQEMELARIVVAAREKMAKINHLIEMLSVLDIDPILKQDLINMCQKLFYQSVIQRSVFSECTEADAEFLSKIQKIFPHLNQRDIRILQLIRFGYESKDIAQMIGKTRRGTEGIRYTLHKKLGLGSYQSIKSFLSEEISW